MSTFTACVSGLPEEGPHSPSQKIQSAQSVRIYQLLSDRHIHHRLPLVVLAVLRRITQVDPEPEARPDQHVRLSRWCIIQRVVADNRRKAQTVL